MVFESSRDLRGLVGSFLGRDDRIDQHLSSASLDCRTVARCGERQGRAWRRVSTPAIGYGSGKRRETSNETILYFGLVAWSFVFIDRSRSKHTVMASQNSFQLPAPSSGQKYVDISPIPGGFITLAENFFVKPFTEGAKRTVPSLTFLVKHPGSNKYGADPSKPFYMMFDLGLRKAKEGYPEVLQKHLEGRAPYHLAPGVAAQLKEGGLDPSEINLVMLSHVHYDHHGDPEDFEKAHFTIGQGAMSVLKNGLGGYASHQHFDPDTLPDERSSELPDPTSGQWKPLGPFPATLDLFEDGSVYVIDTPGHLPGHVNLLCRTKDKWICLCGDAFHDRRLLTGEKEIGEFPNPHGDMICIHVDKEAAAESIRRIRALHEGAGDQVEIIAAHEDEWWERNKGKKFPGTL